MSTQESKKVGKIIIPLIFGISCITAIAFLQLPRLKNLTKVEDVETGYEKQEQTKKLDLELLKQMPSFGFGNLIADWVMLQFIQYTGDGKARRQTDYSLSPSYLETVIQHDPLYVRAYLFISPSSSIFAGKPEQTVALMEEGLKSLSPEVPLSYFVWLYKGVDEFLFLGDVKSAINSYQMAAEWAEIAGDSQIAQSASRSAHFLSQNPNSGRAKVGAWFSVWVNAPDERTRQLAKQEIKKAGGTLKITPDGRAIATPPKE